MADPITEKMGQDDTVVQSRHKAEGGTPPPYLVVIEGPRHGSRYPLHDGETILGRGPWSHILLEDQSVSRRHCMVERAGETISVRDLGSKNGTRVNESLIGERVTIGHADLLHVGIYTLRFITRPVTGEEEFALASPVREGFAAQAAEGSAETAAMEAETLAGETEAPQVATEGGAGESDEQAATMVGRLPAPQRRLWLFLGIGLLIIGIGVGAVFAYLHWTAPPLPEQPVTMLTRVIPAETTPVPETGETTPVQRSSELPLFVDFASSPMPARVVFQEKDYGMTPIKVNVTLRTGEPYVAEGHFVMPEFQEEHVERVTFTPKSGEGLLPVFFRAPIGIFKIEKIPREVELTLQGYFSYDQFTPRYATLADASYGKPVYVPYGRYIIELRRPKEIGASGQFVPDIRYRREILLSEDSPTLTLQVSETDLETFPVEIHSAPAGADLFIDSKPVGKTPFTGAFPLGEHTLVLRKEGYFEHAQTLKNDINVIYRLDVLLKTTAAGELLNEGHQLVLKGRFKEAINAFSKAFEKSPTDFETAKAQYLLGTAFLGLADLETAKGYFEQAKHHPEYALRAKLGLVRILARQQKSLEALPLLVEVMLRADDDAVKAEARATFKEISPLKSVIYVRTDPAGADVFLNGEKMVTQTPLILHDLGLGNYTIRLEREGHLPKEVNINLTVHEFNPVIVRLQPVTE
ncbi:MAG: PEGA domain-containing protein [Deltaproteobacteria bacterium]|nr:PEGA domain-containing protein [Deltaproteobacteria bacterium]